MAGIRATAEPRNSSQTNIFGPRAFPRTVPRLVPFFVLSSKTIIWNVDQFSLGARQHFFSSI